MSNNLNLIISGFISINRIMENEKSPRFNNLITHTSRQYYSRRIPQQTSHDTSRDQLQKIIKMLNINSDTQKSKGNRLKTEGRDVSFQKSDQEISRAELKIKIENILKKSNKIWKELYDSYEKIKLSKSREIYVSNEVDFYAILFSMIIAQTQKMKQRKFAVKTIQNLSSKKDRIVQIQNVKLYKENLMLKQKFIQNAALPSLALKRQPSSQKSNQPIYTSDDECIDFNKQSFQKLKQKIKSMEEQVLKLKEENIVANQQLFLLKDERKSFNDKLNQQKIANQNLCAHILSIKSSQSHNHEKILQWTNIMAMQREEISSHQYQKVCLRQELLDLDRKYKATLKRINKVNTQNLGKIPQISKKCMEIFVEQLEAFQKIRSFNTSKSYYPINSDKSSKDFMNQSQNNTYKKFMTVKQTISNENGIKKMQRAYYTYLKPTFYQFIEKYLQTNGVDKNNYQHINVELNLDFLATLRAIMDSKHNQFMLNLQNFKQNSNFSTFCLSWLCNFQLDPKTKKVVQVNTDINYQHIATFYIRLMSQKLNLNWQIVTFRQFLLQSLTIDELYFYLRTRFILFKGDLMEMLSGVYSDVYYINYLDALFLIQKFVTDFDYRKKIEQYLKKSIEYQRKRQLIDAHYVLRMLLEFYQHKKNQIYANLSRFFEHTTKEKNTISFDMFLKAFDYSFTSLTLIDKAQIYQKCYSLSRGQINIECLFAILNQERYFCTQALKHFSCIKIQKKPNDHHEDHEDGDIPFDLQPDLPDLYQAQLFHQTLSEGILKNQPVNLGLQTYKKKTQQMKIPNFDNILNRFRYVFDVCILNLKKMHLTMKIKDEQYTSIIPDTVNYLKKILKLTLQKRDTFDLLRKTKTSQAARQIFKFYKKKKRQINRKYLTAADKAQVQQEKKTNDVRNEFNNLIQSLKNKYNTEREEKSRLDIID